MLLCLYYLSLYNLLLCYYVFITLSLIICYSVIMSLLFCYSVFITLSFPLLCLLELGALGSTGEGNDVADVLHTGDEQDETLEAQSEPGMRA